jgi:hypothetical protein
MAAGIERLRATLGRKEPEKVVREWVERARVELATGRQATGQLVRAL